MSNGSLARRYAKALLQLGVEDGSLTRIGSDVSDFASAMKSSPELLETLTHPSFPRSEREAIVVALLQKQGAGQTTVNFCKLLLDRERMAFVPDISRELDTMINDHSGRVTAQVRSATPLTPAQKQQLTTKLEQLSGRKIDMQTTEDPELLGGLVATVGDMVYDGSLKSQLQQLRDNLAS